MEIEKTLAGAIVGSLNNILVAHIEGGELGNSRWELRIVFLNSVTFIFVQTMTLLGA
jgi:UDP-N-acetylglucosamine 2-epimerase